MSIGDAHYSYDSKKIEKVKADKLWMTNPKYFQKVNISPSATAKMMIHAQFGVDKGTKRGGKPIEVMGLLIGRPDSDNPREIVISDAQPIPIEGFETSVVANDEKSIVHMIEVGETLEATRKEVIIGWYHTHPFEVDVNSHCYLSGTDILTQASWQKTEDRNGNPFVSIVIDPLRSVSKGRPELSAFRVYPPEYNPPQNETPDGTFVNDEKTRLEKWGSSWNRYYKLEVSFFMSSLAQNTLNILKNNFLWQNVFLSNENDNEKRTTDRIQNITDRMATYDPTKPLFSRMHKANSNGGSEESGGVLAKPAQYSEELSVEQCNACMLQQAKAHIFSV